MTTTLTPNREAFRLAVDAVAAKAHEKLPACNGRVDAAVKLVLAGDVELLGDGTAQVYSQSNGVTSYHLVNGHCDCADFPRAPHGYCKHRLSVGILRRATEMVGAEPEPLPEPPPFEPWPDNDPEPVPAPAGIDPRFVVEIRGKMFIRYEGLLAMAHASGLVSLKARFLSVTTDIALAEADATFADGRTFSEAADATPGNVGAQVRPHFARLALTRAKARVLRDALNIGLCSLEELD